jgi:coenzyme F420-0:L-glutamate ligase/coenzyme F420-1:gamma-L-glutamate ligase
VRPGDDLAALLGHAAGPADVLVLAHKVVSKAEGRLLRLSDITPSDRARSLAGEHGKDARLVQAILDESASVLRVGHGVFVCVTHHGFVCANAGVDQSNSGTEDEVVLLPVDPDASARRLRAALPGRPAVVISDSFGRPFRLGETDVAIGAAGLRALDEWEGRADAFGRPLRVTTIAVADAVAALADLARAKDSLEPAVVVRGLSGFVTEDDGPGAAALRRSPELDLFRAQPAEGSDIGR